MTYNFKQNHKKRLGFDPETINSSSRQGPEYSSTSARKLHNTHFQAVLIRLDEYLPNVAGTAAFGALQLHPLGSCLRSICGTLPKFCKDSCCWSTPSNCYISFVKSLLNFVSTTAVCPLKASLFDW